jgi:hypothetical protein
MKLAASFVQAIAEAIDAVLLDARQALARVGIRCSSDLLRGRPAATIPKAIWLQPNGNSSTNETLSIVGDERALPVLQICWQDR